MCPLFPWQMATIQGCGNLQRNHSRDKPTLPSSTCLPRKLTGRGLGDASSCFLTTETICSLLPDRL